MSRYFTLYELTASRTAAENGIDNTPGTVEMENLGYLAERLLDEVRQLWGKPVYVVSGYRSHELNKAVGGVRTSQHCKGQAADITTGNPADNMRLFDLIAESPLPFDQLIDEKGGQWLHISYNPNGNRRQILHL